MANRRQHGLFTTPAVLLCVLLAHGGLLVAYEYTRPPPPARVTVVIRGSGSGTVVSTPSGLKCDQGVCTGEFQPGEEIALVATLGEKATFIGWSKGCQVNPDYIFECRVMANRYLPARVTVTFGEIPEEIEVALADDHDHEEEEDEADGVDVALPDTRSVEALLQKPPTPIEELIEEDKPKELIAKIEPKPAPKEEEKPKQEQPTDYTMKSVEVPDQNEVENAPDDAKFLSDKNRDVAEQTRAKDTNLDKQKDGEQSFSEKSNVQADEVGAKDDLVAETEDSEASDLDADDNAPEAANSGSSNIARGIQQGDEGEGGQRGQDGSGDNASKPGALSMRGIEGRGAPGGPVVPQDRKEEDAGGKRGKRGKRGRVGMRTKLAWTDFERAIGKDKLDADMHTAQRKRSKRKGRFSRKLNAIRSSLENFNSEVRTGNQTALKTRAAPFAVYIARMHRRIHKLWGFGYLEDLNGRPATDPMNDWSLWTKLEIIILPTGEIEKINIVRPSGLSTFDVAAIDVVLTGGPYEATPNKIRSPDGKVYMHWKFHRDWRQCGTFGAQPFILDKPPKASRADSGLLGKTGNVKVPKVSREDRQQYAKKAAEFTAKAKTNMARSDDPRAQFAANLWLTGFSKRDISKMAKVTRLPLKTAGTTVASNNAELSTVYKTILKENRGAIRQSKLVTAAGYRRLYRQLPPGVDPGKPNLFFIVRAGKSQFALVLRLEGGEYKVVGFER